MTFQLWAVFFGGVAAAFVVYPRIHQVLGIPYFLIAQFFLPPYPRTLAWHVIGTLLMQMITLFFIGVTAESMAVRLCLMFLGYIAWTFFMGQCYSELSRTSDIAMSSETLWQIAWGKITALSVSAITFPILCVLLLITPQAIMNPVTGAFAGLLYWLLTLKLVGFILTIGVVLVWLSILVEGLLAVPTIPYNIVIGFRPRLSLPTSSLD